MKRNAIPAAALLLLGACLPAAAEPARDRVAEIVGAAVRPVMAEHAIPGMAVAVTVAGTHHVFNYGTSAPDGAQPVTNETLFEIGSLSKTFTATLGALAQAKGALALTDTAAARLPALKGGAFDTISLLDLATYSAGGLPLQFPDDVTDEAGMFAFYRAWRPSHAPGTDRLYSNPSIGLFGHIAAGSLGQPFEEAMANEVFAPLGLADTFLRVPTERMADYAWGTAKDGRPVRVTPGVLDAEAYGVKTTASDMIRFVEAQMGESKLDMPMRQAIETTQTGYFRVGTMTQGLSWETYAFPTSLADLQAGNAPDIVLKAQAVTPLVPPQAPDGRRLVNKTGSTGGFGAYAAFVPGARIGVVLLANRNYPNAARIAAVHEILNALK